MITETVIFIYRRLSVHSEERSTRLPECLPITLSLGKICSQTQQISNWRGVRKQREEIRRNSQKAYERSANVYNRSSRNVQFALGQHVYRGTSLWVISEGKRNIPLEGFEAVKCGPISDLRRALEEKVSVRRVCWGTDLSFATRFQVQFHLETPCHFFLISSCTSKFVFLNSSTKQAQLPDSKIMLHALLVNFENLGHSTKNKIFFLYVVSYFFPWSGKNYLASLLGVTRILWA